MRKNATEYTTPEVQTMRGYHGGSFRQLTFYNSDRKIKLNGDYTVSDANPDGIKKLFKPGSHVKGIGLELETVAKAIRIDGNVHASLIDMGSTVYTNLLSLIFSKAGFDDDFFKIESDCTVDGECITQTFSKAWLRNNYKAFKAMYSMFETFNITTNDERCGMHVNLDSSHFGSDPETQETNVRKLGYVINKHYNLLKIAFGRNGSTSYCARMTSTVDYWKNTPIEYFSNSHGISYNLGHFLHQGRVEIRLVGGQRNYAGFRNTMETVFHIIDRVNKLAWKDLDDIEKLFKGCNAHVFDRLSTNCLQADVIDRATVEKIRPTVKMDERFL